MKPNAILFSKVDREDYWVTCGLVFKVKNTSFYEDAYNEIKHKIETPEIIEHLIEDRCLLDDLFDGDNTYKFLKTYWNSGVHFVFINEDENEVEYRLSADFVYVID